MIETKSEQARRRIVLRQPDAVARASRPAASVAKETRDTLAKDIVSLQVEDDGRGMSQENGHAADDSVPLSVGMAGVRERMRQIGGSVSVESAANGTRVRATVPLSARV